MKFSVLASGSKGNAIYIESATKRILVDAGLSAKQIETRLSQIGVPPASLDAILITHEHIDHVKGLGVLARRYRLDIYMNEPTWQHLPKQIGEIPSELWHPFSTATSLDLASLHIDSFAISHDAAEPMAFRIQEDDQSLSIVTDLGYVSQAIIDRVAGSDALIWESNHDIEMLRMGSYPWNVKRRILSDIGHLSNEDAGEALCQVLQGKGEQVYLAHLSQENNLIELAQMTVTHLLQEAGFTVGRHLSLYPTYEHRPTPLQEVQAFAREKRNLL